MNLLSYEVEAFKSERQTHFLCKKDLMNKIL